MTKHLTTAARNIKETWTAEESKFGKALKNWGGKGLLFIGAIAEFSSELGAVPPEFVPKWLRMTIFACGFVSFVAGKMTKKEPTV